MNGFCNDDMIQFAHSIVNRCFNLFRSVMRISYTFSCNTLTRYNQLDSNVAIFYCHSWDGINSGVSSCNNPMVSRVLWVFQVSQGSVETLFRWGGKHLYHFTANFFHESAYQILLEYPQFYRRYYKKHFGLFFLDTLYYFLSLFILVVLTNY